jgi:hypothetical protein
MTPKTANSRPVLVQYRENPRPACLLLEPLHSTAQNPVTSLWTARI